MLDFFGFAVALSGDTALVGSADDDLGADAGAAYVFDLDPRCPVIASCQVRNGTGINPADLVCATAPVVGSTWRATVATTPLVGSSTVATLVGVGHGGPTEQVFVLGFELLALPPLVLDSGRGNHAIPVPDDLALVGRVLPAQGARLEAGPAAVVLTNAQDLVLGCQ